MSRRSVLTWRPPAAAEVPAASARARALLADPQGFGNYMTYRDAYRILGWDPAEVYRDGAIALDRREWADLGWMANHLGPSPRALEAMRAAVDEDHVGPYSPDLDAGLRDLMAEALLGRPRDEGFDVIGTEGAQAGVGYAALACLDPGDEVIVTDPGYFHFVPALRLAGGEPVWVRLGPANGWRLDPDEVAAALTPRTKMVVVCDPVNPFGTVQRREELEALCRPVGRARRRRAGRHHPLRPPRGPRGPPPPDRRRRRRPPRRDGAGRKRPRPRLRHGGGAHRRARRAAGARARLPAGEDRRRAAQHQPPRPGRRRRRAARRGLAAPRRGGHPAQPRRPARRSPRPVVEPAYGFSCVVDVSGLGASAQELTVALCRRRVAVYPGDGLGEVGATTTIRVNLSDPDPSALARFAAALPEAAAEAATGVYRDAVRDLFLSYGTERGRRIAALVAPGSGLEAG